MVRGVGRRAPGALEAVRASYAEKVTDEFVLPTVIVDGTARRWPRIRDGDTVIFFNFRADRARELTRALAVPGFHEFDRGGLRLGHVRLHDPVRRDVRPAGGLPAGAAPGDLRRGRRRERADPVPHRRDREVRARHLLLQRRPRGGVSRRGAGARPEPARGEDLRPEARDGRARGDRPPRAGDRLGQVRLPARELRQPGHGGPHREPRRGDPGGAGGGRAASASWQTPAPGRTWCWRSPPTTGTAS